MSTFPFMFFLFPPVQRLAVVTGPSRPLKNITSIVPDSNKPAHQEAKFMTSTGRNPFSPCFRMSRIDNEIIIQDGSSHFVFQHKVCGFGAGESHREMVFIVAIADDISPKEATDADFQRLR
ncbi:hypothetical protein JRQ81_010317 [Phrynocephalus forsythii]|uniref:Uncharacterized protein n=1 Tax=Phrynocephalus forsythii TaxID=171643 RepID=A0A9Q1ARR7_9SAUR|nr:hypothetical protein JRQ81_010317 [Phrynocephalus forsythii]